MADGVRKRKVSLAREVGFCFGVKRAINLTRQALEERGDAFIVGDLVHNRRVTDELEAKGLRKVDDLTSQSGGTMVVRAHGIPLAQMQAAQERGIDIVDATCPIVHRARDAARSLEERGCQVVIIGDRHHAEIIGILGSLSGPALVVETVEEVRQARAEHRLLRKVGVIFQTTRALEMCFGILHELLALCREVQVINTICRPVQARQEDALELARTVDLMLVVGSATSANTVELATLCRHYNPHTLHIQSADELRDEQFAWAEHIGIASGLSTPDELVDAVRERVATFAGPVVPEHRPEAPGDVAPA